MKRRVRWAFGYAVLLVALGVLLLLNLASGSVSIPFSQVLSLLFHPEGEPIGARILWEMRLPRMLAALWLGGALSLAGYLLQQFFSNPIAGPFVLGISSSAKLVVALLMITSLRAGRVLSSGAMIGAAFAGALLSLGFVLLIAGKVPRMSSLVICGVMIGYLCSAVTDLLVTFADDSNIVNLHNWSLGSFSGITWGNLAVLVPIISLCGVLSLFLAKSMQLYALGETYAASMGVRVPLFRLALILLSSLLSACVTAFAGPISFVGIAVPHLMRTLFGTSKPLVLLPACFLGGGVFCLFSDLLARTLFSPTELSISSVTAIFGAPIVIWIMAARKKEGRNE